MGFEKHQPVEQHSKQAAGHDHLSHARAEVDNHRAGAQNRDHGGDHKASKKPQTNHDGALHMSDPFAKNESASAKNHAGFPGDKQHSTGADAKPQTPTKSDAPAQSQSDVSKNDWAKQYQQAEEAKNLNQSDSLSTRQNYQNRNPYSQQFGPESADQLQQKKPAADAPMS